MKKKIVILVIFSTLLIVYLWFQNTSIQIERIRIAFDNSYGVKIAHLSDIHFPQNGASVDRIIKALRIENPDLIFLTGDIIDQKWDGNIEDLERLCSMITEIARVYAVHGNHEEWSGKKNLVENIYERHNIRLLQDEVVDVNINGKKIKICGLDDNTLLTREFIESRHLDNSLILLHRPEYVYMNEEVGIGNVIFCGHAHGGQFRIPFINKGVVSPGQGILPDLTSGIYEAGNNKIIVSRGLGNSIIPIRINNRPHIPIVIIE